MKKIILLLILCSFPVLANISSSFASTQASTAEQTIHEAKLMQQSINRFILRIRQIESDYPEIDAKYIENTLTNLLAIIEELENIEKWRFTISWSREIINNTLSYIRLLNTEIQNYIQDIQKQRKSDLERWMRVYDPTIKQIHELTSRLIEIHSRHYLSKAYLSDTDRKAVQLIIRLRERNTELYNYRRNTYANLWELQSYLRNTIVSMRKDMTTLRTIRNP